jgi:hypothetical protein
MRGMIFQFSLATLLVCTTVLAVVSAVAVRLDVDEWTRGTVTETHIINGTPINVTRTVSFGSIRRPMASDVAWRLIWWGGPAIAATLAMLWLVRRMKSRRENGPPVG